MAALARNLGNQTAGFSFAKHENQHSKLLAASS
jgi:hypothetical protein